MNAKAKKYETKGQQQLSMLCGDSGLLRTGKATITRPLFVQARPTRSGVVPPLGRGKIPFHLGTGLGS
jgi:hypothetical protein